MTDWSAYRWFWVPISSSVLDTACINHCAMLVVCTLNDYPMCQRVIDLPYGHLVFLKMYLVLLYILSIFPGTLCMEGHDQWRRHWSVCRVDGRPGSLWYAWCRRGAQILDAISPLLYSDNYLLIVGCIKLRLSGVSLSSSIEILKISEKKSIMPQHVYI